MEKITKLRQLLAALETAIRGTFDETYRGVEIDPDVEELKLKIERLFKGDEEKKKPPVYKPFDLECELSRYDFYRNRDGRESASVSMRAIKTNYLAVLRNMYTKPGGRKHPYRYGYIETCASIRYLMRRGVIA